MTERARPRPIWQELPSDVREAAETLLGARVVEAQSRSSGWSPGSADRVVTANGRRAFIKTASAEVNEHTLRLHRREAEVLRLLDGTGAAPTLHGTVEVGPWFGLVEEDIDGRHPDPSSASDVAAVLDAVALLPRADGAARKLLRTAPEDLEQEATGWRHLFDDDALTSVPIDATGAAALDSLADGYREALAGDRIVHLDLRFDNVLIDASGRARLVDWPGAAIGAGWLDALTIVLEVRRLVGAAPAQALLAHPVFADVASEDIDVFLAVLSAYFFDAARQPPSPGVEGVRGFQRLQGGIVLEWLRERRPDLPSS